MKAQMSVRDLSKRELQIHIDSLPRDAYQQTLLDHTQSHGVYNLTEHTIDQVKAELKAKGATKFRTIKNGNLRILCYRTVEPKQV